MSDQDNKPWEWGDKGVPQNPINHYPEGTRFLCCGYDGHMNQFSQGNWVRHEDYAKLQMERIHDLNQMGGLCEENARLKAECQARQAENSVLAVECDSLKAEVERLTLLQVETLDERNRAEADVKALRVELADAQESYHLVNERIAQILKQRAQP